MNKRLNIYVASHDWEDFSSKKSRHHIAYATRKLGILKGSWKGALAWKNKIHKCADNQLILTIVARCRK